MSETSVCANKPVMVRRAYRVGPLCWRVTHGRVRSIERVEMFSSAVGLELGPSRQSDGTATDQ
jgi:hypothetical protein